MRAICHYLVRSLTYMVHGTQGLCVPRINPENYADHPLYVPYSMSGSGPGRFVHH